MCKSTSLFFSRNFKITWTSPDVELAVKQDEKKCSRCQKFKSAEAFYKQGDRLESCCKECKRKAKMAKSEVQPTIAENSSGEPAPASAPPASENKGPPKSYEDLGFTKEEFLEIVDFFQELMRLDQKG
jgi:hypothetical protein